MGLDGTRNGETTYYINKSLETVPLNFTKGRVRIVVGLMSFDVLVDVGSTATPLLNVRWAPYTVEGRHG